MSRIGNKPITVPENVEVKIDGHHIEVKGPKGTLTRDLHKNMTIVHEGNTIKVELVEKTNDNNYGNWCDATNTITIAKTIELEDKTVVKLTEDQITNTFWHELLHCFQFYFDNSYSEAQSQVYANFLCEYFKSVASDDEFA